MVWPEGKAGYMPPVNVASGVPEQLGALTVTTKNQSTLKFLPLHKPNDSPEECASELWRNLTTGHMLKLGKVPGIEVEARRWGRREKVWHIDDCAISGEIGSPTYFDCLYIVSFCKFYDQIRENLLSTYIIGYILDRPRGSGRIISTDSQSAQDVVAGQFQHHRRRYIWWPWLRKVLGKKLKKKKLQTHWPFKGGRIRYSANSVIPPPG